MSKSDDSVTTRCWRLLVSTQSTNTSVLLQPRFHSWAPGAEAGRICAVLAFTFRVPSSLALLRLWPPEPSKFSAAWKSLCSASAFLSWIAVSPVHSKIWKCLEKILYASSKLNSFFKQESVAMILCRTFPLQDSCPYCKLETEFILLFGGGESSLHLPA